MLVASRHFANDATFEIKVRGVLLFLTTYLSAGLFRSLKGSSLSLLF